MRRISSFTSRSISPSSSGVRAAEVREVEPEPVRGHEGARLLHVVPEYLAKDGVQDMGRRVMEGGVAAQIGVHAKLHRFARPDGPFFDFTHVNEDVSGKLQSIGDDDFA